MTRRCASHTLRAMTSTSLIQHPTFQTRSSQWMGLIGLVLATTLCGAAANAADSVVAGVKVSANMALGGTTLQLNGVGVRYKGPFKVYSAALYTSKKVSTTEELHTVAGPKILVLTMLREVNADELGSLFIKGIMSNTAPGSQTKVMTELPRMSEMFSSHKKLVEGDQFSVEWLPNKGAVISVKGVPEGKPFLAPEFFNAMMDIWVGNSPADWKLKDALLGKSVAAPN